MNFKNLRKKIKLLINYISMDKDIFIPEYRVVEVLQNEVDEYLVKIQVINKNMTFDITPEDLLANDDLVNRFSPCDIRSLTYLGYLGINSPKYKILAKRLSENDKKLIFALKKKGDSKLVTKTADEIIKEKDILDNLNAKDAHMIGYTLAAENVKAEKQQKEEAIKQLEKDKLDQLK